MNDQFFLVDLPGFGFAKVASRVRRSWKALVEDYLVGEPKLRGVVHLVDARHDPTTTDLDMVEFLATRGLQTLVVLTKMDKLKRRARDGSVATAVEDLAASDIDALLVVPADVPLLAPRELDALAAPINAPGVRIAPARDGGTNGLLLAPPALIATRFGPDSAARHRLAAAAAGAGVEQLNVPGLAFDIDTPQDLRDFCARTSATQSRAFLEKYGILARLLEAGEP